MQMKSVQWFAPRDMRLVETSVPQPKNEEVLLRIESVGICGSDIHYYLDGRIGKACITPPCTLGHEFAGVVEEVGKDADRSLLGKRVAVEPGIPCMRCEWCRTGHYNVCRDMFFPGGPGCDGALAQYYAVRGDFCFPVPDMMPADVAAAIEPLAVALHAVELAQQPAGFSAAVLGLGPIGLLVSMVARLSGASRVYGTDLYDYRVQMGLRCGCDQTFDAGQVDSVEAILSATGGRGVDVAFDCSNHSETLSIACKVARPAGKAVIVGISGAEEDPIPVSNIRRKELSVQWCRRFRHNYPTAINLLAEERLDVRPLLTHHFTLEQTAEAFEIVANYRDNVLKASIDQ